MNYSNYLSISSIKRISFILLAIVISIQLNAQDKKLSKVGLTLSGGGAKGLAHIGILQAIDSAGLEIGAVTGTSMGAIVGSLYSIGYSGKEIEDIARSMDWIKLILSQPGASEVGLLYKDEYAKYPLQLPVPNGETQAYTGVFEAQDIWNELARLYLPVYDIKKFSEFNIPFLCIAADLATGEPIVLRDGDIVTSVRSSMAIPSVFTAVPHQDRLLIDGGVVHNFPVEELSEFGVNYRIGVNVSRGLLDLKNLDNPLDVLLQVAFFNGTHNLKTQKTFCDLLIEPELGNMTASSFSYSDSIIEIGIATGLSYYPYFKELADSLNSNRSVEIEPEPRLPAKHKVIIDTINVIGLDINETALFIGQTGLIAGNEYKADDLAEANRKAYSSLAYRRISYVLDHNTDNHVNISYSIVKAPDSFVNLGLHYNLNSGLALLAGVSSRNKVLNNSLTCLRTNISENFRIKLKHHQFLSKKQVSGIEFGGYYENMDLSVYQDFRRLYLYKSQYAFADLRLFKLIGTSSYFGMGIKKEWLNLNPKISPIDFKNAENNFWTGYVIITRNTLDRLSFPGKGLKLRFEAASVFSQNPDTEFSALSQAIQLEDSNINDIGNYYQLKLKYARYISFSSRTTMFFQINSGINFDPQKAFLNYYSIGGLQDYTRNQIVFAGLTENEITSNSVISLQLGFRAELYENIFTSLQGSIALYDFIGIHSYEWNQDNLLDGYALSAGYNSFLGPIELSVIYNNKNKNIGGYLSAGIAF